MENPMINWSCGYDESGLVKRERDPFAIHRRSAIELPGDIYGVYQGFDGTSLNIMPSLVRELRVNSEGVPRAILRLETERPLQVVYSPGLIIKPVRREYLDELIEMHRKEFERKSTD